jgi:hypothetical protein
VHLQAQLVLEEQQAARRARAAEQMVHSHSRLRRSAPGSHPSRPSSAGGTSRAGSDAGHSELSTEIVPASLRSSYRGRSAQTVAPLASLAGSSRSGRGGGGGSFTGGGGELPGAPSDEAQVLQRAAASRNARSTQRTSSRSREQSASQVGWDGGRGRDAPRRRVAALAQWQTCSLCNVMCTLAHC